MRKMSKKQAFWLGIDCGGTYLKAGLYDAEGHEHGIVRQALQTMSPLPGYAERDMHQLWQHCAATIAGLLQRQGYPVNRLKAWASPLRVRGSFSSISRIGRCVTPSSPPIVGR